MITVRKLSGLKPAIRLRKYPKVLGELERRLHAGEAPDWAYLRDLCRLMGQDSELSPALRQAAHIFAAHLSELPAARLIRRLNGLRHRFLAELGLEPADWDLLMPCQGLSDGGRREPRPVSMAVYLDDIRSPFNLGSLFRSAEALGAGELILSPDCPSPDHPRAKRSAMGCTALLPWRREPLERLTGRGEADKSPQYQNVFALELGGTPLDTFPFPKEGLLIIGSEELGVSPEALALADQSAGRVSIPLSGTKASLNVGVAFGIVMQAWRSYLTAC